MLEISIRCYALTAIFIVSWQFVMRVSIEGGDALTVIHSVKTLDKQEGRCDAEFSRVLGLNLM